jgi:hypothetical protein
MADQSDVESALVGVISAVLYPQGVAGPSLPGPLCRVYRGWPNAAALDADLAAGVLNVTVFPQPGHAANTTRWATETEIPAPVLPQLNVSVSGTSATFSGSAVAGQIAGLLVDGIAVVHRTTLADTPALVAAVLASQIRTQRIALLAGTSVTVPGVGLLLGRVVADQTTVVATRRQRQGFRITFWCPDPASRDVVTATVDSALSAQTFLPLPDGTAGRLRFASTSTFDQSEDAGLYRRDVVYDVEYATTLTSLLPEMIFGDLTVAPDGGTAALSRLG